MLLLNYSQLFGEEDADQEVSPDRADPEASCELNYLGCVFLLVSTTFILSILIAQGGKCCYVLDTILYA